MKTLEIQVNSLQVIKNGIGGGVGLKFDFQTLEKFLCYPRKTWFFESTEVIEWEAM